MGCEEEKPAHTPKHEVERLVLNFTKDVKNDVYAENIYFFEADTEFTPDERKHYFRRLEKFIRNNNS